MLSRMIDAHIHCFEELRTQAALVERGGEMLLAALLGRHRILVCGNGGSAADAQHFAAELIGRFQRERRACPAIALTTDTSILTAIGNDYGYDQVFSRQVEGLGGPGDVLVAISTSGGSGNVIRAVETASALGMATVGLLGRSGGRLKGLVDHDVVIPEETTARVQEVHEFILHYWAWHIENGILREEGNKS